MPSVEILHTGDLLSERLLDYLGSFNEQVTATRLPDSLPMIVDYPREFLPEQVGAAQVTIAVNIHHDLLVELPMVISEQGGQALIAPREDPNWIRPGLMMQVNQACTRREVECAFPEPFCAIQPATPMIEQFCEQYRVGPTRFELMTKDEVVVKARYIQGTPCGLSRWVAERLSGVELGEALVQRAKTLHHSRPCLSSMTMLPDMDDTLMHKSLYAFEANIREVLATALSKQETAQGANP